MNLRRLIKIVETSAKRSSKDAPLTLGHLTNILKMYQRLEELRAERERREHYKLLDELDPLGQEGLR